MSQIPAGQEEAVETFLGADERVKAAHGSEEKTFVVTSKRLLSLEPGDDHERRAVSTESIAFDAVSNVEIDVYESQPYDLMQLIFAAGAAMLAMASFAWGMTNSGELARLAIFLAAAFGLGTVGFIYEAFNTDAGRVRLEVTTARDGSHSVALPKSGEDVAVAVSEHAV